MNMASNNIAAPAHDSNTGSLIGGFQFVSRRPGGWEKTRSSWITLWILTPAFHGRPSVLDHCPQQSTGVKIFKILREARRKSTVTKGEKPSVVGMSVKVPGTQKQLGSALRILNRLFTIPILDKSPSPVPQNTPWPCLPAPGMVHVTQKTPAVDSGVLVLTAF